jgi:hypothetical protein
MFLRPHHSESIELYQEFPKMTTTDDTFAPVSPTVRFGSKRFDATTNEYGLWSLNRIGLTLEDAIEEAVTDYRHAREYALSQGETPAEFAAGCDDLAIWAGVRLRAVIRPQVGEEPEVTIIGSDS